MNRLYCLVMLLAVLAGCTSHPENVTESDALPAIYPDYIDVTIPTGIAPLNFSMADDSVTTIDPAIYPDYIDVTIPIGIAPLNFSMADDSVTTIDVTIKGKDDKTIHANGSYADFDIEDWHQLLEENKGGTLAVSVCAEKDGRWTRYRDFTIHVSQEPLDHLSPHPAQLRDIQSHGTLSARPFQFRGDRAHREPRTQWYLPELPYSQSHESRPIRVPCPRRSWCYHHPPQRQGRIPESP